MNVEVGGAAKRDLIAAIIDHALEDLRDWHPPTPRKGIGPVHPKVFHDFLDELNALRADLHWQLDQLGVEELRRDFAPSATPQFNLLFDRDGRHYDLADRLAQLKKKTPANYVGGWAIVEKQIDLEHWRGQAEYRLTDATLLSVGRDPRFTNFNALFAKYGQSEEGDELLYFLEDLHDRIAAGFRLDPEDQNAKIGAADFFIWVRKHQVQIDPRFRRMLKEQFPQPEPLPGPPLQTASQPEDRLHGSSKSVAARIILAVAKAKYGLDDAKKVGKVARAIQADGDFNGLSFDAETVRKWLLSGLSHVTTRR